MPRKTKSLTLKASEEFVVGKHSIGWVDSDFKSTFSDQSLYLSAFLLSLVLRLESGWFFTATWIISVPVIFVGLIFTNAVVWDWVD